MEVDVKMTPRWQKELETFKGVKSTFIIEGNIKDYYPLIDENAKSEEDVAFQTVPQIVHAIFEKGKTENCYDFLYCDPLLGFTDPLYLNKTNEILGAVKKSLIATTKSNRLVNQFDQNAQENVTPLMVYTQYIREAMTERYMEDQEQQKSLVVIVDLASHLLTSPDYPDENGKNIFLNLLHASRHAISGKGYINTLVLMVDKAGDIPSWFFRDNPNVRKISIPSPDLITRKMYINKYISSIRGNKKIIDTFADVTFDMKLDEINHIRKLKDNLGISDEKIKDAVSIYKYGFKEDPWESKLDKLKDDPIGHIEKRVMGQRYAVEKIVTVLKRAVTGMSGMQHSSSSAKPRGIFFLSGATGTGKTEMAKTIAELLFEDEKALVRFDMSEYSAEHSDQKLFGAPPGYVGYSNGGQLTNAIRNNPFCILLFDEIEKAHSSIMDKFLQILEDGRMTDGQGNTVSFSETLIFFTSNLGIQKEETNNSGKVIKRINLIKPGEPYKVIEEKVEAAMDNEFKPEVKNRIGNNIIVFDFLSNEASKNIAKSKISKINKNVFESKQIDIEVKEEVYEYIYNLCWTEKVRNEGGRGVGNVIESDYLNPLSEYLFDNSITRGMIIVAFMQDGQLCFKKKEDKR